MLFRKFMTAIFAISALAGQAQEKQFRQVFEPITLTTYATMSYIPKFQIGNETVTIFRRWACPTLTAVCLPNFRVQR